MNANNINLLFTVFFSLTTQREKLDLSHFSYFIYILIYLFNSVPVPSLPGISWFKESKHTHRSSLANITNDVRSLPDSKRISILIEAVLPTLQMLYLPFQVYLDSKRVSVLIEAVLPTLPILYLLFQVYVGSKGVSILIEAVLPYQCCTFPSRYILIQR